jgi:hypothetical protein
MSDEYDVYIEQAGFSLDLEIEVGATGPSGPQGSPGQDFPNSFETVNKNLAGRPYVVNRTSDLVTSIVYTVGAGTITKTLAYSSGLLTSIVLSGLTPSGISLTKTLSYTDGQLTGVAYS